MEDPRYPIGPFRYCGKLDPESRARCIAEIGAAPGHLRAAVADLTPTQLDTRYREGGLDGSTGGPPRSGQPPERLHPIQAGADRRGAHDQAVR
jgi:hypothetical protein